MAIIVRYEIRSTVSFTPIIHSFATQAGARHFLDTSLPPHAANLSIWVEEDPGPKQQPTYSPTRKERTDWWDENKRPFTDRPEREELAALTTLRKKVS